jgi:hypothetical protein
MWLPDGGYFTKGYMDDRDRLHRFPCATMFVRRKHALRLMTMRGFPAGNGYFQCCDTAVASAGMDGCGIIR